MTKRPTKISFDFDVADIRERMAQQFAEEFVRNCMIDFDTRLTELQNKKDNRIKLFEERLSNLEDQLLAAEKLIADPKWDDARWEKVLRRSQWGNLNTKMAVKTRFDQ